MKSGGSGTSPIDLGVVLSNPGRIDVRSGTLQVNDVFAVNDGTITVAGGTTFSTNGQALTNNGTIGGNGAIDLAGALLTNGGTVAPGASPGRLMILGDFTQSPAGVLAMELAGVSPGVTHDLLQIAGTANLGGTLDVVTSGGFVPAAGDRFGVMTYGSRVGDFARFNYAGGSSLQREPGAFAYVLTTAQPQNPQPPQTPPTPGTPASSVQSSQTDILYSRSADENERLLGNLFDLTTSNNAMEEPRGTSRQVCR
jgi:hypothetical protein